MASQTETPPLLRASRPTWELKPVWRVLVLGAVALAGLGLFFALDPAQSSLFPTCLFHRSTGLLCPGCGSQRALHQLLHGHVLAALHCNALLVLALPWAGGCWARWQWARFRGAPRPVLFPVGWVWVWLAAALVFGILRNCPFAQALWLAP